MVDLPSYKMVIFHSYVSLPEGNNHLIKQTQSLATWEWEANLLYAGKFEPTQSRWTFSTRNAGKHQTWQTGIIPAMEVAGNCWENDL